MDTAVTDIESSRRLAHTIRRRLEDMIFSGRLGQGDVLSERKLAEALDVSRTPLRDALLMLEADGLLKRRGTRYLEVRELTIAEYMHILNIRRLLEPEAARLATGKIDRNTCDALLAELQRVLEEAQRGLPLAEPEDSHRVDNAVHETIAEASGNPLMAGMIRDLRKRTRVFDLRRMPDRFLAVCSEHIEIVQAISDGDGGRAGELMVRHIDNFKQSIIRHLSAM